MGLSPFFIDLSNNDPIFDPKRYRVTGHVIIALKASEGTHFKDGNHRDLALKAGSQHIAVMHYHFGRPDAGTTGTEEADFFLECTRGLLGPRDFVVYDGERARNGGFGLDPTHCRQFDERIQEKTRFHTILYASASQLPNGRDALVGDNKRDWDANYSSAHDTAAPGHVCVCRQFTDGVFGPQPHGLPGGPTRCDVNIMRGQFRAHVFANA